MSEIVILNGPSLNLLGTREPEIYGSDTLADIDQRVGAIIEAAGHSYSSFQDNAEHGLIERLHEARGRAGFVIINPGAFTHTSIALRDAFLGVAIPFVEVHVSNIFGREEFRRHSYLSDIAVGCIVGLGASGYEYAAHYAVRYLDGETGQMGIRKAKNS